MFEKPQPTGRNIRECKENFCFPVQLRSALGISNTETLYPWYQVAALLLLACCFPSENSGKTATKQQDNKKLASI
jgi:hypothetical protein